MEVQLRDFTIGEFERNLARARSLIGVYELSRGGAKGRRSVSKSDVLRAATVFLHSSLEEVFRNVFLWKLPSGRQDVLNKIPLVGSKPNNRPAAFLLGELAAHRGRIVDNVIRASIEQYVDNMNINHVPELQVCIEMIGLNPSNFTAFYPDLGRMMARRHQIVHQMDRNHQAGVGQHSAQSISVALVERWASNLNGFVRSMVAEIPD